MVYVYAPKGVCSKQFAMEVENNTLVDIEIQGGCPGNLQGLAALTKGMDIDDIIKRLEGIKCGARPTSCPDQLAIALKEVKKHIMQEAKVAD